LIGPSQLVSLRCLHLRGFRTMDVSFSLSISRLLAPLSTRVAYLFNDSRRLGSSGKLQLQCRGRGNYVRSNFTNVRRLACVIASDRALVQRRFSFKREQDERLLARHRGADRGPNRSRCPFSLREDRANPAFPEEQPPHYR